MLWVFLYPTLTELRLLCYCGLRVAELCALDRSDLTRGERPTLVIRHGKGGKRRSIPLSDADCQTVDVWLAARPEQPRESALFIGLGNQSCGMRLSVRGVRRIVDRYLTLAGWKTPGRSCHALRHSLATWLLDAGVPIEAIADLLGHTSVTTTSIYAKVVDRCRYIPGQILVARGRCEGVKDRHYEPGIKVLL
jgi:integrase